MKLIFDKCTKFRVVVNNIIHISVCYIKTRVQYFYMLLLYIYYRYTCICIIPLYMVCAIIL